MTVNTELQEKVEKLDRMVVDLNSKLEKTHKTSTTMEPVSRTTNPANAELQERVDKLELLVRELNSKLATTSQTTTTKEPAQWTASTADLSLEEKIELLKLSIAELYWKLNITEADMGMEMTAAEIIASDDLTLREKVDRLEQLFGVLNSRLISESKAVAGSDTAELSLEEKVERLKPLLAELYSKLNITEADTEGKTVAEIITSGDLTLQEKVDHLERLAGELYLRLISEKQVTEGPDTEPCDVVSDGTHQWTFYQGNPKTRSINFHEAGELCSKHASTAAYFTNQEMYNRVIENIRCRNPGLDVIMLWTGITIDTVTGKVVHPDGDVYTKWYPGYPGIRATFRRRNQILVYVDMSDDEVYQGMANFRPDWKADGVICQKILS